MKRIVLLLIPIILAGCGFFSSESIKNRVDSGIAEANQELLSTYKKDRKSIDDEYQKALKSNNDTLVTKKLHSYHAILVDMINYTDNLKIELKKIDTADIRNDEIIKKMFIQNKKADTLFAKIGSLYSATTDISLSNERRLEISKSRINLLGEPNTNDRINTLFELNTPQSTTWLLYGLEQKLLETGIKTLHDYNPI